MTNSYVQVAVDSTGKKIQNFQNTVDGHVVQAQAVSLVGPLGTPIPTDTLGRVCTHIGGPNTAFGEVSVAEHTPVIQIDFVYGLNTNVVSTAVTGSGTATAASNLCIANTTAATNSSATIYSKRYAKYRTGQGVCARFTALFTAGAANSKQYAGTGIASMQEGYFFGYNGTAFGICHVRAGVETWTIQADWNVDNLLGTDGTSNPSSMNIDPTKGNVYQIKEQYLGFGAIQFFVERSDTGEFILVHVFHYANANTVVNTAQPSQNLIWRAANTSNNTAISVKGASGAIFIEGKQECLGPRYGADNSKTTITTLTNVLTLRNATSFNGVTNYSQIRIRTISFSGGGSAPYLGAITLRVILNTTLGGSPSFAAIDGTTADGGVTLTNAQSVTSKDTAGTTITGGVTIFNGICAEASSQMLDVTDLDLYLNPGETMTFAISSLYAATVAAAVSWSEDI